MISWLDARCHITEHFTVFDACWLPKWRCLYMPTNEEQENLIRTCHLMEKARAILDTAILVHVMIRPDLYNKEVGGAANSPHIHGLACDFHARDLDCGTARILLLPHLEKWSARMENNSGNWVHLDLYPPNPNRWFK